MKELWAVVVEKAKGAESYWVLLGVGIFGLFLLWASTSVINNFFKLIIKIVELVSIPHVT